MKRLLIRAASILSAFAIGLAVPRPPLSAGRTEAPARRVSHEDFAEELHRLTTAHARELEASLEGVREEAERDRIYQEWNARRKAAVARLYRRHGREAPGWSAP